MKKLFSKILLLTLCFTLAFTLLPLTASAADETETLYFANRGGVWGLYVGVNGNTTYSETSKYSINITGTPTLTLKNGFSFTTSADSTALYMADGTALVVESGTATVASTYTGSNSQGILAEGALDISVVGSLNAKGGDGNGVCYGIYADGALTISGSGTVNATGGDRSGGGTSYGIYADETLTISGNVTVNASGDDAANTSCGIIACDALDISGGTVNATGSNAFFSYGIWFDPIDPTKPFTISGGTVTAMSGTVAGSGSESCGVKTDGSAPTLSNGITVQGATAAGGALVDVEWDGSTDYTYKIGDVIAKYVEFTGSVSPSGGGGIYGGTYASNQIANNPQLAPQGSIYGGYGRFTISSTGFFRYFDPNNTLTANGSKLTVGQDYDVHDKGGYAIFEIYESTMQSLSGSVTFKATFTNGTSGSCTVNVGAGYVPAEINVNAPKTGGGYSAIGFVLIAVVGLVVIAVKKVRA